MINTHIFILIIILCIIFMFINKIDTFTIVGYNNTTIPENTLSIPYFMNTDAINTSFKTLFSDDNLDWTDYDINNDLIPFPFNDALKQIIVEYLIQHIPELQNDNLIINENLSNIHWKDINNDRLFIFNANIINNTNFISRILRIKLKINNIKQFLKNNNTQFASNTNYLDTIPYSNLASFVTILSIRLESHIYPSQQINGIDKLQPLYYLITNQLYLMYPYSSSRTDMLITQQMKNNFKSIIEEHAKRLQNLSH